MKCCVCKKEIIWELGEDELPICGKKKCVKTMTEIFGSFCQAIDEETGMETEGFKMGKELIRYSHFDEDFERAWRKNNE